MNKIGKMIAGAATTALVLLSTVAAGAQTALPQQGAKQMPPGPPFKTTFIPLSANANAVLYEPVTPNDRSRILIIRTHPEHANNLNSGRPLVDYGYRVLTLNYYGREQNYYEYMPPIAEAIKAARAISGVEKVVLYGYSSGGPEVTSYQDVAENGPKACQEPNRIYKCDGKGMDNLPKADGLMLIESAGGAPERTDALNPAIGAHDWAVIHPELDMFSAKNGFNAATHSATYSDEFLKKFFAAQAVRSTELIEEAETRLDTIKKGEGKFTDDEPFVVTGTSTAINGSRPLLADTRLMGHVHAPHMLLKADGTRPMIKYPLVMEPEADPAPNGSLYAYTLDTTVRTYLSFQALRLSPDYHITEDNIFGVDWRSSPNSVEGNVEGIHVPTLVMTGTCAPHIVYLEIAYDLSAAKDKDLVGVEGANHALMPCKAEYGDTSKRAYDYVDSWLSKPGRF